MVLTFELGLRCVAHWRRQNRSRIRSAAFSWLLHQGQIVTNPWVNCNEISSVDREYKTFQPDQSSWVDKDYNTYKPDQHSWVDKTLTKQRTYAPNEHLRDCRENSIHPFFTWVGCPPPPPRQTHPYTHTHANDKYLIHHWHDTRQY